MLDVIEEEGDDAAGEIEEVEGALGCFAADKAGQGQVAGEGFSCEAAHDDFFVCGGHGSGGLSHVGMGSGAKKVGKSSQFANAVLHSHFVSCFTHISKRLIRCSLCSLASPV